MQPIKEALLEAASLTETELEHWLSSAYTGENTLAEAMRYATLGGGKRIRAFLTLSVARMFGGEAKAALPFAAAIEMIHAYSLVHDDMPCMDNDDMRRGKPSCHKAFGEANALLTGDTLLTEAFEVASSNTAVPPASALRAVRILAQGAGALGMAGGQYYDLAEGSMTYDELRHMQKMKTGALIRIAVLLGYYAAVENPAPSVEAALTEYANQIGLAFQMVDDLLDVTGDEATLGKPIGSDRKNDKRTVLSYLSLKEAEDAARRATEAAKAAIASYPDSEMLCALADYLLKRKN